MHNRTWLFNYKDFNKNINPVAKKEENSYRVGPSDVHNTEL